jgi:energy-coupling factor transporter ATP-binding protein EcfA2
MSTDQISLEQVFVEQAEYLEDESFTRWSASHPDEDAILRKLTHGGAKLISGPRGCGKTTLLKKAFHMLISDGEAAFPIYVNYKRSLSIEPLYTSGKNGTYWFHQWIILKIYQGIYETLKEIKDPTALSISLKKAKESSDFLEMSNSSKVDQDAVSIGRLEEDILRVLDITGRYRCVLLLDDAAHAFSPDQQRDFFDFFRQIKSKEISPKAAIYPGVTNYSSSFHVGHDAEQIDVWIKPDRDEYIQFMRTIIGARFPSGIDSTIEQNAVAVDFLCYASFGVPRALLNMLQSLIVEDGDEDTLSIDFSRASVLRAVKQHYGNTKKLFTSLIGKVPVYKRFIETGEFILGNSFDLLKKYNKGKEDVKQSVSIAIPDDEMSPELIRVFALFQYAGLCIPKDELVSRGEKGRFRIFTMHYAGLVDTNALLGSKSLSIQSYVRAFTQRNAHEFTRTRPKALLLGAASSDAFALSLPPCAACGTPRLYEEAQFCAKCGNPLTLSSTYLNLMNSDIGDLPLTEARVRKIKEQSSIRKVKDILMDLEHSQLLQVDRVGKIWAAKIVRLAEEFVE